MKKLIIAAFALAAIAIAPKTNAQTKMVGGAAMYPTKNIVENAVNSKDHTTLVAAVKAAGLVETLEVAGHSPYLHQLTRHLTNCLPEQLTTW